MPWDDTARVEHGRDSARYPGDLTDREWALIAPLLPGAIGVRRDGQKVLLSIKNMGEECQVLCVSGRRSGSLADRPQPWIGLKRSSNMMANWFTAVSQPLTVREVFSWPRIAR